MRVKSFGLAMMVEKDGIVESGVVLYFLLFQAISFNLRISPLLWAGMNVQYRTIPGFLTVHTFKESEHGRLLSSRPSSWLSIRITCGRWTAITVFVPRPRPIIAQSWGCGTYTAVFFKASERIPACNTWRISCNQR